MIENRSGAAPLPNRLQRLLVLMAALAAPVIGYGQMAKGLGRRSAEFAARLRLWPYPLPIAWGLIGAFAAAHADGEPTQAYAALAGAVVPS